MIGSIVGDNLQHAGTQKHQTVASSKVNKVRVCDVTEQQKKVITGYNVTISYAGLQFSEVMARRPGEYVDVSVDLQVVQDLTTSSSMQHNTIRQHAAEVIVVDDDLMFYDEDVVIVEDPMYSSGPDVMIVDDPLFLP